MSDWDGAPRAFAFFRSFDAMEPETRAFPFHYLLYASSGAFTLRVDRAEWLLPPQRAAWIAANTPVCITIRRPVTFCSALFAPGFIPAPEADCRVFGMTQLAREMVQYAVKWDRDRDDRDDGDETANRFFLTLADVCRELAHVPDQFWMPRAQSELMQQALQRVDASLDSGLSLAQLAEATHLSERTLARRFDDELGMTWRDYLNRARMLRAMQLLAEPGDKVVDVALRVGFNSVSAFNSAFRDFTGETPSHYRKRFTPTSIHTSQSPPPG
jgi:AraC-like DNA-binding protein